MNEEPCEQMIRISLDVNGVEHSVLVDSDETLLEVLRQRFNLVSCRETCGIGVCGSCTVLVNGLQVSSCISLAVGLDGSRIETAEHVTQQGPCSVREAFIRNQAFQCSFCTPGFVIAVEAWRRSGADEETLHDHLSGHLCRCGCYAQILAAANDLL